MRLLCHKSLAININIWIPRKSESMGPLINWQNRRIGDILWTDNIRQRSFFQEKIKLPLQHI